MEEGGNSCEFHSPHQGCWGKGSTKVVTFANLSEPTVSVQDGIRSLLPICCLRTRKLRVCQLAELSRHREPKRPNEQTAWEGMPPLLWRELWAGSLVAQGWSVFINPSAHIETHLRKNCYHPRLLLSLFFSPTFTTHGHKHTDKCRHAWRKLPSSR